MMILEKLATVIARGLSIHRMPADTMVKGEDLCVSRVIAELDLEPFPEEDEDYTPDAHSLAERLLDNVGRLLEKCYVYAFPKADITTDAIVFGLNLETQKLQILLIERGREGEPFYGCWALPGGYLDIHTSETIQQGLFRELKEETHLDNIAFLEQLATFGRPDRDPRGRVITVAYWGIVQPHQVTIQADDDAKRAEWFNVDDLPDLAFDHSEIVDVALRRLRGNLRWQPTGCWLLEDLFTLNDLRKVYEIILGREIDLRSFRKKVRPHIDNGILVSTDNVRRLPAGRPASLYRFDADKYETLRREGLAFEV